MSATIIDGKAIAKEILIESKLKVDLLILQGCRPGLAVVLVGDDPASTVYVNSKERACKEVGISTFDKRMPESTSEGELLALIDQLNDDVSVHGILVQLPLPRHINEANVLQRISRLKDVDGFNWTNLGALLNGYPIIAPCTPSACLEMILRSKIPLSGQHAVVLGRSSIVGKPLALMLLSHDATVTICHSKTRNLSEFLKNADIVLSAVGKPGIVMASMVKPGAAVIDIGINRLANGQLCGDVDYNNVLEIAKWITPVPGGVGPVTVAMVIANTILATESQHKLF